MPDLYLVTPVAFDTATFNPVCHASLFSNCNKINAQLMSELSEELAAKGMEKMPSIYDAAAKSLADDFYHFVKDGKTGFKYKTIAVGFKKEGGPHDDCSVTTNVEKGEGDVLPVRSRIRFSVGGKNV